MFSSAVERSKSDLRARVEESATDVFLKMTTEKVDYQRLRINDQYGLAIIPTDGREEESRSSGAEQVVALALMGALQANAPLRRPIVMDTPFGRLDRRQIGLSAHGKAVETRPTDTLGWFKEGQEACRFALAYAVREGVSAGTTDEHVDTRWSADGFDPTGEIRQVLRAAYPGNTTPVRLMEYLIDEGLRRISASLDEGKDSPVDYLG